MGKGEANQHIQWCLKQKRGIRVTKPNQNLSEVYIKKSKSAIHMLDSAIEKGEVDWIVTTAYYARYFAFYALLQLCGIKSEIHECTISLMKSVFVDGNILNKNFYREFQRSKDLRIEMQYYVTRTLDLKKLTKTANTAKVFLLVIKEVIERMDKKQMKIIRNKLAKCS
tara:strand:- start:501 stop:1004 length:504 start_codon:yes stop_codon:yes gene_type:complete